MGILLNTLDNLLFKQHVSIALQHVLASAIKRKIALVSDACSKPPITIRSHDLHASNIRRAVGEIASYHKKDYFPFFWFPQVVCLLAFLWPSLFVSPVMVLAIFLLLDFCHVFSIKQQVPTKDASTIIISI
jgi:hypothetical protein